MDNPESDPDAPVDAGRSPFYEWLDSAAIRELVHRCLELSAGERLVLIKGLVPGLVEAMGLAEFDAFLAEVAPADGARTRSARGARSRARQGGRALETHSPRSSPV